MAKKMAVANLPRCWDRASRGSAPHPDFLRHAAARPNAARKAAGCSAQRDRRRPRPAARRRRRCLPGRGRTRRRPVRHTLRRGSPPLRRDPRRARAIRRRGHTTTAVLLRRRSPQGHAGQPRGGGSPPVRGPRRWHAGSPSTIAPRTPSSPAPRCFAPPTVRRRLEIGTRCGAISSVACPNRRWPSSGASIPGRCARRTPATTASRMGCTSASSRNGPSTTAPTSAPTPEPTG